MALIDVPSTAASGLIRNLVEQHFATEKPKGKKPRETIKEGLSADGPGAHPPGLTRTGRQHGLARLASVYPAAHCR